MLKSYLGCILHSFCHKHATQQFLHLLFYTMGASDISNSSPEEFQHLIVMQQFLHLLFYTVGASDCSKSSLEKFQHLIVTYA